MKLRKLSDESLDVQCCAFVGYLCSTMVASHGSKAGARRPLLSEFELWQG